MIGPISLMLAIVFVFWIGFIMGDARPRDDNKKIIKVLGGLLIMLACLLGGMLLA